MKSSDLIYRLQEYIDECGDLEILSFKIRDELGEQSYTRIDKEGNKLTVKAFLKEIKDGNKNN